MQLEGEDVRREPLTVLTGYPANKRWRRENRARYEKAKQRYYAQFVDGAFERYARWEPEDEARVVAHAVPDRELAAELGRTVQAIQVRRARIKRERRELGALHKGGM